MRRLLIVALVALVGCTPAQVRAWVRWHATDPEAALAYLETPEGRDALAETVEVEAAGADVEPGDCESYWPLMERHGLPRIFLRVAWRESGCDHRSYVVDHDDAGGGLLGINLKGSLAATWRSWCGVTLATVTDAETNVRCAGEAYERLGMRPWS